MEIINQYFGKIIFVKADLRENHTIYVAALSSSFQDGKKQYALAFVPVHLAIINQGYLSDLQWVNLQTRTMTNGYRIRPQRWEIPKGLDNPMFSAVERSESKTRYVSDTYALEMVLIHDPKKKSKLQYHTHMNLLAALATFKCVISLTESSMPRIESSISGRYPVPSSGYNFSPINTSVPEPLPSRAQPPSPSEENYIAGGAMYSPGMDGRYSTIGLSDYTIPQISQAPQKKIDARRETPSFGNDTARRMVARPPDQVIDDSFELIQ